MLHILLKHYFSTTNDKTTNDKSMFAFWRKIVSDNFYYIYIIYNIYIIILIYNIKVNNVFFSSHFHRIQNVQIQNRVLSFVVLSFCRRIQLILGLMIIFPSYISLMAECWYQANAIARNQWRALTVCLRYLPARMSWMLSGMTRKVAPTRR